MSLGGIAFCYCHDLAECPWYNALPLFSVRPHHGVSFPAASLAVGEYGAVITVKDIVYKRESALLIDQGLGGVSGKHEIVGKILGRLSNLRLG